MGLFSGIMVNAEENGYELSMEDVRIQFNEAFEVLNAEAASFESFCGAIEKLELLNASIQQNDGKADKSLIAFLNQNNGLSDALGIDLSMENFDAVVVGAEVSAACEGVIGSAWEAIKNFFKNIWDGIKNFFTNFFNMFKGTKSNLENVKNDPKAPEKIANAPAPANPSANAAVTELAKKVGVNVKMLPAPANNTPAKADQNGNAPQQAPAQNTQSEPKVFGAVAIKAEAFIRVFNGAKNCYEGMKTFMSKVTSTQGTMAHDMIPAFMDIMAKPLADIGVNLVRSNDGKKLVIGTHKGALAFNKTDLITEGNSYGDILAKAGFANGGGIDQLIQCAKIASEYKNHLSTLENDINKFIELGEKDTTTKAPNSAGPIEDKAFRQTQLEALKNIGKCAAKVTAIVGEGAKFLDIYSKELKGICEKYQKIG